MSKLLWEGQLKEGKTAATKTANRYTAAYAISIDRHAGRFRDATATTSGTRG